MAEAADRVRMARHSEILAAMYNSNPFREGEPLPFDHFNPYSDANRKRRLSGSTADDDEVLQVPLSVLRDLYVTNPNAAKVRAAVQARTRDGQ